MRHSLVHHSSPSFWGDQELQQDLADLVCAGLREDMGRDFCTVGTSMARSVTAAGEGRVVARDSAAAGTPCRGMQERELPFLSALLIKELLFLAV